MVDGRPAGCRGIRSPDRVDHLEARSPAAVTVLLRTQAEATLSADVYKSQHRADLQAEGHRIVASIGDQVSDMSKGRLKAGFLLPNLMYFIP